MDGQVWAVNGLPVFVCVCVLRFRELFVSASLSFFSFFLRTYYEVQYGFGFISALITRASLQTFCRQGNLIHITHGSISSFVLSDCITNFYFTSFLVKIFHDFPTISARFIYMSSSPFFFFFFNELSSFSFLLLLLFIFLLFLLFTSTLALLLLLFPHFVINLVSGSSEQQTPSLKLFVVILRLLCHDFGSLFSRQLSQTVVAEAFSFKLFLN